jgi:hypothetical protein
MKNLLIIFSLLYIYSCSSENATSSNDELLIQGAYVSDTLYAIQDTFILGSPVRTSSSQQLSVGKFQGMSSNFLINFVFFPADTIQLDSAYIEFTGAGNLGDGSLTSITVDAYKVLDQWGGNANQDEFWRTYTPNGDLVYSGDLILCDSLKDSIKYKIPIDNATIKEWQQTDDSLQTGLYFTLSSGSGEAIAEIASFNTTYNTNAPKLIFKRETDSTAVWDTLVVGDDLPIYPDNDGIFQNTDNVYIASGNPVNSFVKFDLSKLPENIIIYSAELSADLDSSNSLVNSIQYPVFYLRVVSEANDDLSSYTIDSSFYYDSRLNIAMTKENNSLQLSEYTKNNFGQHLLQKIVNKEMNYEWFFIQYGIEWGVLSVERIMGIKNPPHKERLIVKYIRIDGFGCEKDQNDK